MYYTRFDPFTRDFQRLARYARQLVVAAHANLPRCQTGSTCSSKMERIACS
jgi:hypothetical protein